MIDCDLPVSDKMPELIFFLFLFAGPAIHSVVGISNLFAVLHKKMFP